jgi:hypothetical protein
MGKQKDRLIAVVHLAIGKTRLVRHDELDVIFPGHIRGGNNGELAPVDAAVELYGTNEAAWNGAADRGSVPHAFPLNVVYITRPAQQLVYRLFTRHRGANYAGFQVVAHGWRGRMRDAG